MVNLSQRPTSSIKAVHGAPAALKVHDVELLVQKRVQADLMHTQSLVQVVQHLFIHIIQSVFILTNLEEFPQLL